MNSRNQQSFHRRLFSGQNETVTILKRDDNQGQGTVRAVKVFQVRKSMLYKTGETIQGEENSNWRTTWHLPLVELKRAGIAYINPADRIVQKDGNHWQPESTTMITTKLMRQHVDVECLSVNPPKQK